MTARPDVLVCESPDGWSVMCFDCTGGYGGPLFLDNDGADYPTKAAADRAAKTHREEHRTKEAAQTRCDHCGQRIPTPAPKEN